MTLTDEQITETGSELVGDTAVAILHLGWKITRFGPIGEHMTRRLQERSDEVKTTWKTLAERWIILFKEL